MNTDIQLTETAVLTALLKQLELRADEAIFQQHIAEIKAELAIRKVCKPLIEVLRQ